MDFATLAFILIGGMFVCSWGFFLTAKRPVSILFIISFWICLFALGAMFVQANSKLFVGDTKPPKFNKAIQFTYPNEIYVIAGELIGNSGYASTSINVLYNSQAEQCSVVNANGTLTITIVQNSQSFTYTIGSTFPTVDENGDNGIMFVQADTPVQCVPQ